MNASGLQAIITELVVDVFVAPVWWYTTGAKRAWERFIQRSREGLMYLGVKVWFVNLFVPMYGQTDYVGRFISLIVRMAQLIARSAVYLLWLAVCMAALLAYLVWPIIVLVEVLFQLTALPY